MADFLKLEAISKTYSTGKANEVRVLEGADLTLKAGEVLGLIAPSGSGKSTLLNIAGLLDQPSAGGIYLDGNNLASAGDRKRTALRREEIGFVFQFHHLLSEFSALENVMLPLRGAGVSKAEAEKRARSLLEAIGLGARLKHRPSALSGGEAQRVAICRALAARPRLLLADEPTGNLDPDNAAMVFDFFIKLAREEGMAAIIATHNHELASRMDRVVDLRDLRPNTAQ